MVAAASWILAAVALSLGIAPGVAYAAEPLRLLHGTPELDLRFLPGGRHAITFSTGGSLRIWELPAARMVQEIPLSRRGDPAVALDGVGRTLALGAWGETHARLFTIDAASGRATPRTTIEVTHYGLALSPDGNTLAAGHRRDVRLFSIADGRETRRLPIEWPTRFLAFTPDGATLIGVSDTGGGESRAWDPSTGASRWKAYWAQPHGLRVSALGDLALVDAGSGSMLYRTADGTAALPKLISWAHALFHPDGKRAITWADRSVGAPSLPRAPFLHLVDLTTGMELPGPRTWYAIPPSSAQLDVSSDGRWIATASRQFQGAWVFPSGLDGPRTIEVDLTRGRRATVEAVRVESVSGGRRGSLVVGADGAMVMARGGAPPEEWRVELTEKSGRPAEALLRQALNVLPPSQGPSPGGDGVIQLEVMALPADRRPPDPVQFREMLPFCEPVRRGIYTKPLPEPVAALVHDMKAAWSAGSPGATR